MKPREPSLPTHEWTRISYGEGYVAEGLKILKKPEIFYWPSVLKQGTLTRQSMTKQHHIIILKKLTMMHIWTISCS
jgi:hypothetical protein